MAIRTGWGMAFATAAVLAAGTAAGAGKSPGGATNPVSDKLLTLPPAEQAAQLAGSLRNWCIGTQAFLMGVVGEGPGAGNAYWSLRCADGSTWAVQIDPLAHISAIGCDEFKDAALGKECFKKF